MSGWKSISAIVAGMAIAGCGGYQNAPKIDAKVEQNERIKALIKGLKDPSPLARGIAAGRLEQEAIGGNPDVKDAVSALEEVAKNDKDAKIKEAASKALAKIKGG